MPKISVLMNCYNGEKYLKEAIDSVFVQTFTDWEIVFIDNCSIDNSAKIAKNYGDKIKYYKTEENIPLGGARNFGLNYCKGDYISFLDTDDIWLPEMLEEQLKAIESNNYALAYAGQVEININGDKIGEIIPIFKEGYIFDRLLLQFDIPIVSTILRKSALAKSKLNFDKNVSASEEYCLFLQLSIDNKFIVIPKALVKYRIHENALTNKTISKWADERRYTLNKIIEENEGIEEKFNTQFKEAFARAAYYDAQYLASINEKFKAFKVLSKYAFLDKKYFILSLILLFPSFVWKKIQQIKYGRKI
ncbi:glycosyltransferase [bacterium]|nr:glycosyltransferase [bacterium]